MRKITSHDMDQQGFQTRLKEVSQEIEATLSRPLEAGQVLQAAQRLSESISPQQLSPLLTALGMTANQAEHLLKETRYQLSAPYLKEKIFRELGPAPFEWSRREGVEEAYRPLGVLAHITAGNAWGLPAMSAIEGLLAGNVNLIKLPEGDDGLSELLLQELIRLEPALSPYLYLVEVPSSRQAYLRALLELADGAAVWGSDAAISGVRRLAPPSLQLIEWGHRLSFAYVTQAGLSPQVYQSLAEEIALTEQLLCSSPQCVYYEAENWEALCSFGEELAHALDQVAHPAPRPPLAIEADIAMERTMAGLESLLGEKKLFAGGSYSVIVDREASLVPSPMYRNVFVKAVSRDGAKTLFRREKGYLQTVGLACGAAEASQLQEVFFRAGASRVVAIDQMSRSYPGQPHDGQLTLARYMKRVVRASSSL